MSHTHQDGGPVCIHPTRKVCDKEYGDWQAMQQVLLAYTLVTRGTRWLIRNDKGQFGQLVRWFEGKQTDLFNGDGNPATDAWSKRLRAAVERVKAGDLPVYTLYEAALAADTSQEA